MENARKFFPISWKQVKGKQVQDLYELVTVNRRAVRLTAAMQTGVKDTHPLGDREGVLHIETVSQETCRSLVRGIYRFQITSN